MATSLPVYEFRYSYIFLYSKYSYFQGLMCSKNCGMNSFLAILELCAFYIKYKKVKFMASKFRGRTNLKYFMQTQLLRFYKDTPKASSLPLSKITANPTHFLPAKRRYRCCEVNFKQIKHKMFQNVTSKHRAVKRFAIHRKV